MAGNNILAGLGLNLDGYGGLGSLGGIGGLGDYGIGGYT